MKLNSSWQLPLYTAALLTTLIACDRPGSGEAHVALHREQPVDAKAVAAVATSKQQKEPSQAAPGDYRQEAGLLAVPDTVAVAAVMEEKTEEQLPPGPKGPGRQAPAPRPSIQSNPAPRTDWDKKIVKTASLSVEVKDYGQYNTLARAAVKAAGGYVANEEQNESAYKIENVLTIKVPVDRFDEAVAALTPANEKVLVRKITAEDVTGEVVDTRSRLEARKQVRLRYLELLKQAKNMEEILQVQNEINSLQENIEAAAGRVQYLTHAAAFSTIQLSFFQVLDPAAGNQDAPPGFGKKILAALGAGLGWLGELAVLLVMLWPLWAVVAVLWWLIRRNKLLKRLHAAAPVLPASQPLTTPSAAPDPGAGKQ